MKKNLSLPAVALMLGVISAPGYSACPSSYSGPITGVSQEANGYLVTAGLTAPKQLILVPTTLTQVVKNGVGSVSLTSATNPPNVNIKVGEFSIADAVTGACVAARVELSAFKATLSTNRKSSSPRGTR